MGREFKSEAMSDDDATQLLKGLTANGIEASVVRVSATEVRVVVDEGYVARAIVISIRILGRGTFTR